MKDPDYGHIGDHTETVQVDFDPSAISYAELLTLFWRSHHPQTDPSWSRQYQNAVFYHDERQRRQALASRSEVERQTGAAVLSVIAPLGAFYPAEDYHQKYLLKRHADLSAELRRIYPEEKDLVASTAAARINGYAGGNGTPTQLAREIDLLGLSPRGRRALTELVRAKAPAH